MVTKNITSTTREISAENGYVHKIGTEIYFKKGIMLPSETIDMYEEVVQLPKYTELEYKEKVRELILERYTLQDELALHRLKDKKPEEFTSYYNFCEECKIKAKKLLMNKE